MQTFKIEMMLPDNVDPSDLLERMQCAALEIAEDNTDEELTARQSTEIENAVSVQAVD